MYLKCSNISVFNEELKYLVRTFHNWFLKQSTFEASEALQNLEGMILKKTRWFCWVLSNFEVEEAGNFLIIKPKSNFCVPRCIAGCRSIYTAVHPVCFISKKIISRVIKYTNLLNEMKITFCTKFGISEPHHTNNRTFPFTNTCSALTSIN